MNSTSARKTEPDAGDFKKNINPHPVRRSLAEDGSLDLSAEVLTKAEVVTAKCKRSSEGSCDTSAEGDPKGCVSGREHNQPSVADAKPELRYQFDLSAVVPNAFGTKEERLAYCRTRQRHLVQLGFALDADSKPGKLVFNRTITLKDAWAKIEKKQ